MFAFGRLKVDRSPIQRLHDLDRLMFARDYYPKERPVRLDEGKVRPPKDRGRPRRKRPPTPPPREVGEQPLYGPPPGRLFDRPRGYDPGTDPIEGINGAEGEVNPKYPYAARPAPVAVQDGPQDGRPDIYRLVGQDDQQAVFLVFPDGRVEAQVVGVLGQGGQPRAISTDQAVRLYRHLIGMGFRPEGMTPVPGQRGP